MGTYNLCVDRKCTIWEREYYTIEAQSETEALEKCLDPDTEGHDVEYMYDTIYYMTPKDNDNYPTLEVFNDDTNERIFINNPVSVDIYKNNSTLPYYNDLSSKQE